MCSITSFPDQLDEYCSALLRTEQLDQISDANATLTLLSNRTKDLWKSPRGTVIRIEVLVVVAVFLHLFLVACGSRRRRSRNFLIQKGVLIAYTCSSSLVSYTLGSMQSSDIKSSMYSLWAISLYVLFGCADSITAYSLTDNTQVTRQAFQSLLGMAYVVMIMSTTLKVESSTAGAIRLVPLVYLTGLVFFYHNQRLDACLMASQSLPLNKLVADYMMYQEHTMSKSTDYDPATMTGYHYIVDFSLGAVSIGDDVTQLRRDPSSDPNIIYLDKVWRDDDLSPDLKDACLSFSLFHLLRRRFFGFECGESSQQPKTRDLVFKGLLAKKKKHKEKEENGDGDYNWVFKVIEMELAFMYDFFFTKYAAIHYGVVGGNYKDSGLAMLVSVLPLLSATLMAVTAVVTTRGLLRPPSKGRDGSVIVDTTAADVGLTVAVLVCISFLQVVQLMNYWTTIWGRVSFVCQGIKRKGCCMWLKGFLVTIGHRWQWHHQDEQKLGQYSLLESVSKFSSKPKLTKSLAMQLNKFLTTYSISLVYFAVLPDIPYNVGSVIQKPGKPAELLAAVKEALVESLTAMRSSAVGCPRCRVGLAGCQAHMQRRLQRAVHCRGFDSGCKLTNGVLSLSSSGAYDQLSWACTLELGSASSLQKENQVYVILTWHIATCCCDKGLRPASSGSDTTIKHYEVATRLSKYCAYLVAFAPKLLPGHPYDTWLAFTCVAKDALEKQPFRRGGGEETIYGKGLRLGKQLKDMGPDHCWEVLAGFWAEMLLYVAPSDNVKEHVECLAKGGEFITHLWALLTHAGILDRGQSDVVDIENQPASGATSRDGPATGRGAPDECSASIEIETIVTEP